ncbi:MULTISPECIES: MFS transporter [Miniimonas]|uniref:MFS transporter n=1 Tax=Miniimonas TaxID=947525 RepID=UPI0019023689|nr:MULTISPECIES: MFS transporter [Miniimonas]
MSQVYRTMDPMTRPDGTADLDASSSHADWPQWRRDVTFFLSGQTVSLFGSMLVQYAVMWYITLETKDGTLLALSTVFGFLPQAIVSVFGGVWADRHNRKLLAMGADAGIALATLVLALLMLNGSTNIWLIFVAMAVRSTGAGIQTPAVGALIPQIVPPDQLLRINGLNQSIQAGMMLVAPAVAALLYAAMPIERIFFIDVATAIIGIGLLALVPVGKVVRSAGDEQVSYVADLVAGVRYTNGHRLVRWLLGLNAVVMVLAAAPSFLTPLLIVRTFGEELWKLTVLELSFSIGMMLAGATIGFWGNKVARVTLVLGSSVAFGLLTVGMGLAPSLIVFYLCMFLVGVAIPAFTTPVMTVVQETVEPEWQGRVFGFLGVVMAVAMPLGMAVFGPLADVWSVQTVLVVAGVGTLVATVVAVLVPTGRASLGAARDRTSALAFGSAG